MQVLGCTMYPVVCPYGRPVRMRRRLHGHVYCHRASTRVCAQHMHSNIHPACVHMCSRNLPQAHGFCVDTSHFRGLAPGPGLPNPLKVVEALRQGPSAILHT